MTMRVQITDDWAPPGQRSNLSDLDMLLSNITASDGWNSSRDPIDMENELTSRGWYEGTCEFGRYLVINLDKLGLASQAERAA